MFEWLMLLLTPLVPHAAPTQQKDYIGVVAAEAAYASLLPAATPVTPDKPIDPNCPVCKGTGRVKTGDDINWTKCPRCQASEPQQPQIQMQPLPPGTSPRMQLQAKPLPNSKTSNCPNGRCPAPRI